MTKNLEVELKDLKEKNNLLAEKVQYWKILANKRENEKIELMKENNELRMQVIKYKCADTALDKWLENTVQDLGKESLTHLVKVSSTIANIIEMMKAYMSKKVGVENVQQQSPRDKNSSNVVHRVKPMIGGRSIQPVVYLDRTATNNLVQNETVPQVTINENQSSEDRILAANIQDLYIPLRRIDTNWSENSPNRSQNLLNNTTETSNDLSNNDEGGESTNDEQENDDDCEGLEIVHEESESIEEISRKNPQVLLERTQHTPRQVVENPMEGPSWLLDVMTDNASPTFFSGASRVNLWSQSRVESADSTTLEDSSKRRKSTKHKRFDAPSTSEFSDEDEIWTPKSHNKKSKTMTTNHLTKKDVKIIVNKVSLPGATPQPIYHSTPQHAPSPNGSTHYTSEREEWSRESGGRPRRGVPKNYKEKPLNRKLRR